MLEMIVEQNVQELAKIENLEELHKHQDKFTFEEFTQLELAITLEMSDMQEEFYRDTHCNGYRLFLTLHPSFSFLIQFFF